MTLQNLLLGDSLAIAVLNSLPDATAVLDGHGTIVAVNRTWMMFAADNGADPEAVGVGQNYFDMCARSADGGCTDAQRVAEGLRTVLAGQSAEYEIEYPCPSPIVNRWFLLRITPLSWDGSGAVASHVNITRRKMAEEVLVHKAAHDSLTGLANRTLFMSKLAGALKPRSGRPARSDVGLLYIDLNRFKRVNDLYGHDAGDEVLLTCAQRLQSVVRPQDTVARLGGDEFAIVVPRINASKLGALAARITGSLAETYLIHGERLHVPASVGMHIADQSELGSDALRKADRAMYSAKELFLQKYPSTQEPGSMLRR
jgi:diguanylate cyclase (GGDEF)-like protein